jgi:hypothetical protein
VGSFSLNGFGLRFSGESLTSSDAVATNVAGGRSSMATRFFGPTGNGNAAAVVSSTPMPASAFSSAMTKFLLSSGNFLIVRDPSGDLGESM